MAKNCSICGKKLKLLDGKVAISDGLVCASCWASAGLDMSFQTMLSAGNKTSSRDSEAGSTKSRIKTGNCCSEKEQRKQTGRRIKAYRYYPVSK